MGTMTRVGMNYLNCDGSGIEYYKGVRAFLKSGHTGKRICDVN